MARKLVGRVVGEAPGLVRTGRQSMNDRRECRGNPTASCSERRVPIRRTRAAGTGPGASEPADHFRETSGPRWTNNKRRLSYVSAVQPPLHLARPKGLKPLRAGNYPVTTRYNYLLAAAQLGRYLNDPLSVTNDCSCADPAAVTKRQVEDFQAWMIVTRSAATALNKHKALQQFFRWLREEEEITHDPMARVRQPKTVKKLVPVIADEETKRVLQTCAAKQFIGLRDEAIIRLLSNTGARLSEIANLGVEDVNLDTDVVHIHGKGAKDPAGAAGTENWPGGQPLPASPGTAQRRGSAGALAGRTWRCPAGRERGEDPCCGAAVGAPGWHTCMRTGGGIPTRMSGSWPVEIPGI
jgi:hypothetical protein